MSNWRCGGSRGGEDGRGRDDGAVGILPHPTDPSAPDFCGFPPLRQEKSAQGWSTGVCFSQLPALVAHISGMRIVTDARRAFRRSGSHSPEERDPCRRGQPRGDRSVGLNRSNAMRGEARRQEPWTKPGSRPTRLASHRGGEQRHPRTARQQWEVRRPRLRGVRWASLHVVTRGRRRWRRGSRTLGGERNPGNEPRFRVEGCGA